jgi:hypothetical protein
MEIDKLNISFKGERDYIQFGDVYDAINIFFDENISDLYVSKLMYKRRASKKPSVDKFPKNAFGLIFFSDNNGNTEKFYLNETNDSITERREYKEEIIEDSSIIDKETIRSPHNAGFSTIEHIVTLNKKFNNFKFSPEKGKWICARIILTKKLPFNFKKIIIKLKKSTKSVYSVCSINIDGEYFGEVHFVLDQK